MANNKGMDGLIRLHRWKLDEKRRNLVELEQMKDTLFSSLNTLQQELAQEQEKAAQSPVISISYGAYAQQVMVRRTNMTQSMEALEVSIAEAKDQVTDAFKELKKYEIVEQRQRTQALNAQKKQQQNALDEIALNMHRRNQVIG